MSSQNDRLDRAILYHLQRDARMSITDIADAVDVSDNTVRNRINALEEQGAITGYRATVDYDVAGVQHYYIFVCSARVSEREHLIRRHDRQPFSGFELEA